MQGDACLECDVTKIVKSNITMIDRIVFPEIPALERSSCRPLWSVMIPTFNGCKFLEQTLSSLLSQALSPEEMQIVVIDDCSDDDTEDVVRRVGGGRILFHRNMCRLGLVGNWNVCLEKSIGYWVHILHQDDVILDGFYSKFSLLFQSEPDIGAVFCRYLFMDEDGHWGSLAGIERKSFGILENWLEKIAVKQLIQCPSMVVKRSVYETLGGFCVEANFAADWEMWKRIARYYPVGYVPEVLACYRQHSASETTRLVNSGQNIVDIITSIEISRTYLPEDSVKTLTRLALEHCADYALSTAKQMIVKGYWRIGIIQVYKAIHVSCSLKVILRLFDIVKTAIRITLKLP